MSGLMFGPVSGPQGAQGPQGAPGNPESFHSLLFQTVGRGTTAAASGTKYMAVAGQSDLSVPTLSGGAMAQASLFRVKASELDQSGFTTKLKLAIVEYNNTAPAVTITAALYPVTVSGTAAALGTAVTGSAVAFTTPAANSINTADSGDFDRPADGVYCVGYTVSATPGGIFVLQSQVQVMHV